jgi:serine/threonine-protein kinase
MMSSEPSLPDRLQKTSTSPADQATALFGAPAPDSISPSCDAEQDPLQGTQLADYRVHTLLGQGGMGRVYLAWHQVLDRPCAIKIIDPALAQAQPARLKMFFDEARSAAKFYHPHIVAIHAIGADRGYHFIEMEYVAGGSLRKVLEDKGRVQARQAMQWIAQAASALAAAHQAGIVHCDVKPDNVLLRFGERSDAKLTDFGLAQALGGDRKSRGLAGTPLYMAPEIFDGHPTDSAADVYALGATLFHLIAGRPPFLGESFSDLEVRHRKAEIPLLHRILPETPTAVSELAASMLAKDPSKRPSSGEEFAARCAAMADALVDFDELARLAMRELDVAPRREGSLLHFEVPVPGGRRQCVYAETVSNAADSEPLVSFWTPCAPASSDRYEEVLHLNGRLEVGAISIRGFQGQPYFVMVENHLRAFLEPQEIRSAVLQLARSADQIEHRLTGMDRH